MTQPFTRKNFENRSLTINIDLSKDEKLSDFSTVTLVDGYMIEGEQSPQEAFARACIAYSDNESHAQRMYDYVSDFWMTLSTPILSNGGTERGLPISCYLNYIDDSRESIFNNWTEDGWLATSGGGIGNYWGSIRSNGVKTSKGSESQGIMPWLKMKDSQMLACLQGGTRRAASAAYIDISHPEITEFINMRKPTGDPNRKAPNLHHAVNLSDAFMQAVADDDDWKLVDPATNKVTETLKARKLWLDLLRTRMETGEPYLNFIDTANRFLPEEQKKLGLSIYSSNLCNEIHLPTDNERTAVCCLSSVNIEKYNLWKDSSTFIQDIVRFLDNVITAFVAKTEGTPLQKASYSAMRERSIGIGALGWHNFLQSNNIPFDSPMAISYNNAIFKRIKEEATDASRILAKERGEAPDMVGSGLRNAHLLAIAPNASSSIIAGTSPSIEPLRANAFTHKTKRGSFLIKNRYLKQYLVSVGMDNRDTWDSIISHRGSCQHLDFIPNNVKDVFKTALEINQDWIIQHASDRQKYICQGQSINLFFPSDAKGQELSDVHFSAWKKGLKGLYYLRTEAVSYADISGRTVATGDECVACE